MADEALVKARSELKKASAALERLCGDDAAWEKPGASARRWEGSQKWQAITPEELQPATEAIRHKVEQNGFWQSRQSTMKLCYAALHPTPSASGQTEAENLAPYKQFLVAPLGQRIESMFSGSDRPSPLIFKSYLDVLEAAMKVFVRVGFQELFEIGKARHDVLGMRSRESGSGLSKFAIPWITRKRCRMTILSSGVIRGHRGSFIWSPPETLALIEKAHGYEKI